MFINLKNIFNLIYFILLYQFILNREIDIEEEIFQYKEITFNLNQKNPYKIYKYIKIQENKNISLQFNSTSIKPMTIYIYNNSKNINYDERGYFQNYDYIYKAKLNQEKEEFEFMINNEEFYIIFSIQNLEFENYNVIFTIFENPVDILLNDYLNNNLNFFFFYNNHNTNNKYKYQIDSNNIDYNKIVYLHCLGNSKMNMNISIKDIDDKIIFNNDISNLDYYLNITNKNIYLLEIIPKESFSFSIYFEIIYDNNLINYIGNNTIYKNILCDSEVYFYDIINNPNQPIYYILSHSLEKGIIDVYFSYPNNSIHLEKINNEVLYQIALNGNYTPMKNKNEDNIIFYKFHDINISYVSNNIIFIKIKLHSSNIFYLNKIYFKQLPLTKINLDNTNFYINIFNASNYIDRIGYYYISKNNYGKLNNSLFLYTSHKNIITMYEGKYDIVDGNENYLYNNYHNNKLIITTVGRINNGLTIKLINNKNSNYTFQLLDSNNNFILQTLDLKNEHPNKEIFINETSKELYIINEVIYENSKVENIILDPKIIYGDLTLKYFDLDSNENNFSFELKDIFNNKYYSNLLNRPILSNSNLEIIKIENNNYKLNMSLGGLLYLNRYPQSNSNFSLGVLTPYFIKQNKNINLSLKTPSGYQTLNYQFSLGSNYLDIRENINIKIRLGTKELYINRETNQLIGKIDIYNYTLNNIIIENLNNFDFLIFVKFYNSEDEEKNKLTEIYLSSNYYIDKPKINKNFIFIVDWNNILNNINLYKEYIEFNNFHGQIIGDNSEYPSKGYYFQIIGNNYTYPNNNFYLYNSINTSIEYELKLNESHNFFQTSISKSNLAQLLYDNNELYTILYLNDNVPNTKLFFYINYMYKPVLDKNNLILLNFQRNIQSLYIKITKPKINEYIFFQALFCDNQLETEISFWLTNNYESNFIKYNNINIKKYSNKYSGIIELKDIEGNNNYLFNILLPQKMYFQYSFLNEIDDDLLNDEKDSYNINIEEIEDKINISFDRFETNIMANYSVMVRNNDNEKILNECQFLSLLSSNEKTNLLIYDLIDGGNNGRVKIEINLEKSGKYIFYIFATTINYYNKYKLLGYKEYNYNNGNNNDETDNKKDDTFSSLVILLIVSNVFLIVIVISFIIYYCYKKSKNKKNKIIENNSNKKTSLLSTHSSDENISKPQTDENNNISNIQESNFNIINKGAPEIKGSINDVEENKDNNNDINNNVEEGKENNNINNKNPEEDYLESAAPTFNFMKTENPEENQIGNIFAERNNIKHEKKEEDDINKVFVNTETTKE